MTLYEPCPFGESSERGQNQPVVVTGINVKGGTRREQTWLPCSPTASIHLTPQPRLPVTCHSQEGWHHLGEDPVGVEGPGQSSRLSFQRPCRQVRAGLWMAATGWAQRGLCLESSPRGLGLAGPGRGSEKYRRAEKEKKESVGKSSGRPRARGEVWDAQKP